MPLSLTPLKSCLLFVLVSSISLQSCFSKMAFGSGDKWIPKDFDAQNSVFLIAPVGYKDKEKEAAARFMKEKYPYRYEMIETDDIAEFNKMEKFADKAKYRFMLLPTTQTIMTHSRTAGGTSAIAAPASASDFYFYDRLTGTKYPPLGKGSYKALVTFKPLIETVVRHSKK